jgi:hypothetical protein
MFQNKWPLEVNCRYARVAIRELSYVRPLDKTKRAADFKALFDLESYRIPNCFFDITKTKSTNYLR